MSKTIQYWKGYVDGQGKEDYITGNPIAASRDRKFLREFAKLMDENVEPYRSGFFVFANKLKKVKAETDNVDYLRGWFDAQGTMHEKRMTVMGTNVDSFIEMVQNNIQLELPKPQRPSKTSESRRVIITGEKMTKLAQYLGV